MTNILLAVAGGHLSGVVLFKVYAKVVAAVVSWIKGSAAKL